VTAITHTVSSSLPLLGRPVAAVLGAGLVLFASYVFYTAAGILQIHHVQIVTFEPYESFGWSLHFFGATVGCSEPLFWFLASVLLLPSLAAGVLVRRHFGRRWSTVL
jgi:hypothetical protein